jgi:NH3-dependent NAD+ synthetase
MSLRRAFSVFQINNGRLVVKRKLCKPSNCHKQRIKTLSTHCNLHENQIQQAISQDLMPSSAPTEQGFLTQITQDVLSQALEDIQIQKSPIAENVANAFLKTQDKSVR